MEKLEISPTKTLRVAPLIAAGIATSGRNDAPGVYLGPWSTSATPAYARDMSGRFLEINAAFVRKFGKIKIDGADQSIVSSLIHAEELPTFATVEAELRRAPHQTFRVQRWLTPQGWRWMSWEESAIFSDDDELVAVRAVGHDITRQRLAEELYLKLSRAVEQSPVAMVITDLEGRVQYVNPKFTEASGYTLEEIFERNIPVLREGHPNDESYARFWETIKSGKEWQGELVRQNGNGPKIWESVQVSCLRNAAGEITNLLCLKEDITARKRLEDELRQAQKMESLGTLAGGIAHDFNNLLAVINGYVELSTLHPNEPTLLQKSLREIRRASQRAIGLVRQILTFSRKAEINFAPLDLNQQVRDLVALLAETFPRKVTFTMNLADGLPALLADQNQLQQVVLNLCVNARDAMPNGGCITITTQLVKGDLLPYADAQRDKNYACFQVSDTGIGMPAEVRARIFEPFFTTKQTSQGTGLGLAVVYGIVTSHRGYIEVDSTPNVGSTFKLYLPLIEAPAAAVATVPDQTFPGGTESLLIVDDEDPLRNLLRTAFTRKGYSVTSARDGLEAVDFIDDLQSEFDAVLLDLNMPGASGTDVLKAIKAKRPHLPVLILSGHITAETRIELGKLGQREFMTKPYSLDDLGRRLRKLLDQSEQ